MNNNKKKKKLNENILNKHVHDDVCHTTWIKIIEFSDFKIIYITYI